MVTTSRVTCLAACMTMRSCLDKPAGTLQSKSDIRGPFPCDIPGCSHIATVQSSLHIHKSIRHSGRTRHGARNFSCDFPGCSFVSGYQGILRKHLQIKHTENGGAIVLRVVHRGEQLGLNTSVKQLVLHKRNQTDHAEDGGHSFSGDIDSDRTFYDFPCDIPGCFYTGAATRTHLQNHKRTQHDENFGRDFPCSTPGCSYVASQQGTLAVH
eukprot:gnl/TRDRNA2_/TRDRNA2_63123_c0_seq1.p1 gnl/TRDRNA2_/TRDRNA2_63123_c0~~gnl/TRDRNA2_/TRDRNA2_63123_c0_seq1.p1  ORF type:complete len:211 (-),score=12.77 gnl/TRDRNA2_/TRDRNA2_63123_c0_seq1:421-1053(-)